MHNSVDWGLKASDYERFLPEAAVVQRLWWAGWAALSPCAWVQPPSPCAVEQVTEQAGSGCQGKARAFLICGVGGRFVPLHLSSGQQAGSRRVGGQR